jgi:hypothetical protein
MLARYSGYAHFLHVPLYRTGHGAGDVDALFPDDGNQHSHGASSASYTDTMVCRRTHRLTPWLFCFNGGNAITTATTTLHMCTLTQLDWLSVSAVARGTDGLGTSFLRIPRLHARRGFAISKSGELGRFVP